MVKLLDGPVSDCYRAAEIIAEDLFRAIPVLYRVEITEPEEICVCSSIWSSPHSLVPVDMDLALGAQPKVLDMARAFFGSTPARNVKRRSNFPSARISGQIHAGETQYRELQGGTSIEGNGAARAKTGCRLSRQIFKCWSVASSFLIDAEGTRSSGSRTWRCFHLKRNIGNSLVSVSLSDQTGWRHLYMRSNFGVKEPPRVPLPKSGR